MGKFERFDEGFDISERPKGLEDSTKLLEYEALSRISDEGDYICDPPTEEDLIAMITAVAMAEAYEGQEQQISQIYISLYEKEGLAGLRRSTAFKDKADNYKIYLTALGYEDYANDAPRVSWMKISHAGRERDATSIREYVTRSDFFRNQKLAALRILRINVETNFEDSSQMQFKGWTGQGNISDINNGDDYWKRARYYLLLQREGTVQTKLVHVLAAGGNTQFLFNNDGLDRYFTGHTVPDNVPAVKGSDF